MKYRRLLLCLPAALLLSACILPSENANDGETPAPTASAEALFRECETAPAVYAKGGQVLVTLYENGAIPYRWTCHISDPDVMRLVREDTASGEGVPFAAGEAPGYHRFVLEWSADGQVLLTLENQRIPEYSDGQSAPAERRSFALSRRGEEVTIEETTQDDG